jgi:uncharacterized protein YodC (DUF2158 family)
LKTKAFHFFSISVWAAQPIKGTQPCPALTEGDIVTLVSGSPRMAVEGFEGKNINVVWINEGKVNRDTFNVTLLRKFEASEDRGGFKGGDRGGDGVVSKAAVIVVVSKVEIVKAAANLLAINRNGRLTTARKSRFTGKIKQPKFQCPR